MQTKTEETQNQPKTDSSGLAKIKGYNYDRKQMEMFLKMLQAKPKPEVPANLGKIG